jgi:predicted CXXCH cytochrome family protein
MCARRFCTRLAGAALAGLCSGAEVSPALDDMHGCEFVKSLEDYEARIEFSVAVKRANHSPDVLTGIPHNDPANLVTLIGDGGTPVEIDRFSYNCIQCHDGQLATAFQVQLRGARRAYARCVGMNASHPIGMDFGMTAATSRALRSGEGLVFIAGRVGCLSCHDPFNPAPRHLARNNEGSGLCLSCHNK